MFRSGRIDQDIEALHLSLKAFDHALRRLAPVLSTSMPTNDAAKSNGRARSRLSPKARASMVLQGRYMGFMRQLKPRQKARVRKIREAKGVRAAIARARGLAREA